MFIAHSPEALRAARAGWGADLRVALVPTMGALHAGHRSLLARARADADRVVATVFVNPKQFGPAEDLSRYPRPFEADAAACREAGVDLLYAPDVAAVYPTGFATTVTVDGALTAGLCGAHRPGHFAGVATVVLKLLNLVRPDVAYFGQKDFQQWRVLSRMAKDLDLGVEIARCPTVREPDGLALSSRNAYLDAGARSIAAAIPRALGAAAEAYAAGERAPDALATAARSVLAPATGLALQYLEVVDPDDLHPLSAGTRPERLLVAVAAHVGSTRLIDNALLEAGSPDVALAALVQEGAIP